MRHTLPESLLFSMSDFVATRMGLHFPRERWGDLERGITAAAREFDLPDAESCALRLLSTSPTQNHTEILASHLTVGETYFFREKRSFEVLEEHVLPELLRSRRGVERRLRIWSAGCCTGEEPYSVAMLLDRLIPDPGEWNVTILATDINPRFLKKAAEGDKSAGIDVAITELEQGKLTEEAAKKKIGELGEPTPEQQARLDAIVLNAEVLRISQASGKDFIGAGKQFLEMKKAGRLPTGYKETDIFWNRILALAESEKNAQLFEEGLNELKKKFASNPNTKKYFEGKDEVLKKLKRGK